MQKGIDHIGVSVGFLCHDGEGNYVLQKRGTNCRDEHGRWDNGGGGIEVGDTIETTLKKEIREEYGTDPLEYEFLGYRDVFREQSGQQTHWICFYFKVHLDRSRVRNAEPEKIDEIAWFKLKEFPQPLHSQLPAVLELYRDRL